MTVDKSFCYRAVQILMRVDKSRQSTRFRYRVIRVVISVNSHATLIQFKFNSIQKSFY
jgi:hypothetical protein